MEGQSVMNSNTKNDAVGNNNSNAMEEESPTEPQSDDTMTGVYTAWSRCKSFT